MKAVKFIILIFLLFYFLSFVGRLFGLKSDGVSINQLADDIFIKYDKDKDNKLNVAEESFLRTEITTDDASQMIKVESRGLLFTDADNLGNSDGLVSQSELVRYLQNFDNDSNNELSSSGILLVNDGEWNAFNDKYGERYKFIEK